MGKAMEALKEIDKHFEKDKRERSPVQSGVMPLSYKAFCQEKQGILKPEEMYFTYLTSYMQAFPEFNIANIIEKEIARRKEEA